MMDCNIAITGYPLPARRRYSTSNFRRIQAQMYEGTWRIMRVSRVALRAG